MKNLILKIAAAGMLMLAPAIAQAAEGYSTANVNMRAGPSTQYPAVTVIPVGASLDIHGCLADVPWCDVEFYGGRGWVAGQYVQAVYQQRRVYVDPQYYRPLGIPTVVFSVDNYWDRYYRNRDFYRDRDRWDRGPDIYRPNFNNRPGFDRPDPRPNFDNNDQDFGRPSFDRDNRNRDRDRNNARDFERRRDQRESNDRQQDANQNDFRAPTRDPGRLSIERPWKTRSFAAPLTAMTTSRAMTGVGSAAASLTILPATTDQESAASRPRFFVEPLIGKRRSPTAP